MNKFSRLTRQDVEKAKDKVLIKYDNMKGMPLKYNNFSRRMKLLFIFNMNCAKGVK